jgi:small subunit ribosomal protein S21
MGHKTTRFKVVVDGNVQKALKQFKKKTNNEGIIKECRARTEYVKPSERRRKAKAQAIARIHKAQMKAEREWIEKSKKFGGHRHF